MIFGTKKGTTFIFPGTGTGGWESALTNTLSPGDKVVTFRYGQFSHLWIDMMQRMGLEVEVIDCEWGTGADEERLAAVLAADTGKKIKAVAVVHNETTTGVTSDIGKVREAMADHPALLLVDGVSSIGALDFQFDKWGVDVAVTGSQKALSLPTGLAVLAVSEKALAARKAAGLKRCYYDWEDQLATNPAGSVPYTPSIPLLYGLQESLALLRAEGWENVVARHHRLAEGTRKAVDAWGLKLLCKHPRWRSDSLTVIETPAGVDSGKIVATAYSKFNLSIGVGLSKVAGKVFRIGHLGNMDEVMSASALAGTEMALLASGVKIEPGSGVGAAVKYWAETAKTIPTRG
jgi:alanine-glyoxylate transaminase/serine-glyoxylate transaminase/serine-pyruvate transaminase